MRPIARSMALLVLLLIPAHVQAWSGPGHAAVAVMAYRQLSSDAKSDFTELLRSHPNFREWKQDFDRDKSGFPADLDLGMYLFVRASTWPDEIRRTGNRFDHPNWHFVDYPLRPRAFPFDPRPEPEDDVLVGIEESMEILSDRDSDDPETRAAHLSWIIHLIGDLHQPLHCATLITRSFPAPEGDRGGNLFFVSVGTRAVKLHSFWDGQLGTGRNPDPPTALSEAIRLQTELPRTILSEIGTAEDPTAWSLESRDVAVNEVYQRPSRDRQGNIRVVLLRGSRDDRRAPPLPRAYVQNAREVAERRLALAGYRLFDQLQSVAF